MSTTFLSHASGTGNQPLQDGPSRSPAAAAKVPHTSDLPASGPDTAQPMSLRAFGQALHTLRKRPSWVAAGLLLGLLTGIYLARQQPVLYQATARILISGSASSRLRFNSHTRSTSAPVQVADQAVRIKDDAVLNQVIADLDLMNEQTDSRGTGTAGLRAQASPLARATLLRQLRGAIFVDIVPDTRIVAITFTGLDPRFTALFVNKLVADFSHNLYPPHIADAERATQ